MPSQEALLLNILVTQLKDERAPNMSVDKYFELFMNEQILKEYDLSYDELRTGNIGNGGDGGIDGIFLLINDTLIHPDTDLSIFKKNIKIDLHIIQAKNTNSFDEAAIEKFISSAEDIFNLEKNTDSLKHVYNIDLIRHIDLFRNSYINLLSKQPDLSIHYYYASKGDDVHPNVERKIITLETTVRKFFHAANFSFEFMKADKILTLSRSTKKQIFKLQLSESPIATQEGGYICLVNLDDYYKFIIDDQDQIIKYIFDANVRDYQKNTAVNKEINDSLQSKNPEDFWWLNNGITILSDSVKLSGKILRACWGILFGVKLQFVVA